MLSFISFLISNKIHYYYMWCIVLTIAIASRYAICQDDDPHLSDQRKKADKVRDDVYRGCGFTKACLKICSEQDQGCRTCIRNHNCRAIITLEHDYGKYKIQMYRTLTEGLEYISMGISKDRIMGSDAMFVCIATSEPKLILRNKVVVVERPVDNRTNHFSALSREDTKGLHYDVKQDQYYKANHVVDRVGDQGYYLCEFRLKNSFTMLGRNFDLDAPEPAGLYYLFGASGEAPSQWGLSGHAAGETGRTISTGPPFKFTEVPFLEDYDEDFDGASTIEFKSYLIIGLLSWLLTQILH